MKTKLFVGFVAVVLSVATYLILNAINPVEDTTQFIPTSTTAPTATSIPTKVVGNSVAYKFVVVDTPKLYCEVDPLLGSILIGELNGCLGVEETFVVYAAQTTPKPLIVSTPAPPTVKPTVQPTVQPTNPPPPPADTCDKNKNAEKDGSKPDCNAGKGQEMVKSK